jgi:flagellin
MPLSINTNIASLTAQRAMLTSNSQLETSFERLSTGKRINSSVDDAAGLAIGKELESRVSGLNQAIRNVNDAISMVQITEGAYDEVTNIVQRMRDLAVQAASGGLSADEKGYLDTEMDALEDSLNAAINLAQFNGTDLVGSSDNSFVIQTGADSTDEVTLSIEKMSATVLDVTDAKIELAQATATAEVATITTSAGGFDVTGTQTYTLTVDGNTYASSVTYATSKANTLTLIAAALQADIRGASGDALDANATVAKDGSDDLVITWVDNLGNHSGEYSLTSTTNTTAAAVASVTGGVDNASTAIRTLDRALETIASDRAALGAFQSQLESTVRNLANVAENTAAAAGRIMDTDYAAETANLTKAQILQQAATSILAQANAQPQSVLSLLQ